MDTSRSLLLFGSVQRQFEICVIFTVVYLINLIPLTALLGVSPHKCVYSISLTYIHIYVFGCTCFVLVPIYERTKLCARFAICVSLAIVQSINDTLF